MKRDLDLIRRILQTAEDAPADTPNIEISFPDEYPPYTVEAHVELLVEAGYIEGKVMRSNMGPIVGRVTRLTWEGHDFLDATRDKGLWAQAKKAIAEKGGSFTMDLLLAYAKKEAAARLGLTLG